MDKVRIIRLLEKYKNVSQIMGQKEDEELIEELVDVVKKYDDYTGNEKSAKKSKLGETDFQHIISAEQADLTKYELNDSIMSNQRNMVPFWNSLTEDDKNKFTIFELNVILYLISVQYNKYQKKDKQKIIRFIDQVGREKTFCLTINEYFCTTNKWSCTQLHLASNKIFLI